jgi:hypothetical protein
MWSHPKLARPPSQQRPGPGRQSAPPIAKAKPTADLANDAQPLRRQGLEVLPLALEAGLEKPERVSIWIWETCGLCPENSGFPAEITHFFNFLRGVDNFKSVHLCCWSSGSRGVWGRGRAGLPPPAVSAGLWAVRQQRSAGTCPGRSGPSLEVTGAQPNQSSDLGRCTPGLGPGPCDGCCPSPLASSCLCGPS